MSLDARRRSSIYQKLRPLLGDDDANVLMEQFPSSEADELVTKQFLRAELEIAKNALRSEVHQLHHRLLLEMIGLVAAAVRILSFTT